MSVHPAFRLVTAMSTGVIVSPLNGERPSDAVASPGIPALVGGAAFPVVMVGSAKVGPWSPNQRLRYFATQGFWFRLALEGRTAFAPKFFALRTPFKSKTGRFAYLFSNLCGVIAALMSANEPAVLASGYAALITRIGHKFRESTATALAKHTQFYHVGAPA